MVVFNESWFLSTCAFTPCLVFYMYKTGYDLLGSEISELVMRCAFVILIYAIIAYRVETLTK